MMQWWGFNGMQHGWYGFGWLFGFLFWVLVVLGVIYLVKTLFGGNRQAPGGKESPEEILKRRYAAGEISTEEFEDMKKRLKS